MNTIVIETHHENSVEWGVSFSNHNPDQNDYFKMDKDTAIRLSSYLSSKPTCIEHKKELFGEKDMKVVAEMIGDLHYETLAELLQKLHDKMNKDAYNDHKYGREKLSRYLLNVSSHFLSASHWCNESWQISKPFMK